jgi:hypothetical protein
MTEPDDPTLAHVDGRAAVVRQDLDNVLHTVGGDNHVITRPEIDRVVAVLDKAIAEMGGQLGAS